MKTILYSNTFKELEEQASPISATSSAVTRSLNELISEGIVWQGESTPVDNLWETCSQPPQRQRAEAIPFKVEEIDGALSVGGLACGALHEFYYRDPSRNVGTSVAIPTLLARNAIDAYYTSPTSAWDKAASGAPPFFIAWIGRRSWPTPFSLPQRLLSSCLFIDPPNDKLTLWAIETALRSPLIKLVIADSPRLPLKTTRRLSLRAHTNGTTAILMRSLQDLSMPSSSTTKWVLSPLPSSGIHPTWNLTLERSKGGAVPNTSWAIALENDYEDRETLSLRILPRVVDTDHEERFKVQRFG
jgi:protein ImuA